MFLFKKKPSAEIKLFNTKSRTKEVFTPLRAGVMKLYSCGPTVYDYVHIGNLRSFVVSDITRRVFEYAGYKVTQVMNITDFGHLLGDGDEGDDKMTAGLKREGFEMSMKGMKELADRYTDAFKEDLGALHIKTPHVMPRASEHVPGQIAYIETLLHKGYAYKTSDGVYFDTEKCEQYGVLGGSFSDDHSRVGMHKEKKNQRDFALWKFNNDMGWDAPWGKGFPGWHTECVAMSTRYLGKTFDIHTGGIDLSTTHHNNEIAQAEAANNKPLASYWLHHEFVNIENIKISKSIGNTINLRQVIDKGISPIAYRYWLLTGHYRQQMNFTWEAVMGAQTAYQRAQRIFADLKGSGKVNELYIKKFEAAIYDDLNTPEAVAVLWELLKDEDVSGGEKRATVLRMDAVLGFGFGKQSPLQKVAVVSRQDIPNEVQALLKEREMARNEKDFDTADRLRDQIKEKGYVILDGEQGPELKKL